MKLINKIFKSKFTAEPFSCMFNHLMRNTGAFVCLQLIKNSKMMNR